jgi:hypothetical protein
MKQEMNIILAMKFLTIDERSFFTPIIKYLYSFI